jgi:hypothetical protein
LDRDGKLDSQDFGLEIHIDHLVEMNDTYENPSLPPKRRCNKTVSNINSNQNFQNDHTVFPKEIIKKGFPFTNEPYIFFGYNPNLRKYRYVCYNSLTKRPVFRRLENKKKISDELTLKEIRAIGNDNLLQLFCFLNKKSIDRGNGTQYMQRLQTYLIQYVNVEIPEQLYC